ncbi:SURF1 family cytochrome oxidase biogenesis protein, partial [Acinetobacter baumannii]
VFVNRGFVDTDHRATAEPAVDGAAATACGLLRFSEPAGAFLHHNDPASNRWYSRDITAIAASHHLNPAAVAPYFIDANA